MVKLNSILEQEQLNLLQHRFARLLEEYKMNAPAVVKETELNLLVASCKTLLELLVNC